MKPRDVSASVVDMGGELLVSVTFRIPGTVKREDPPNQFRVWEAARKRKQKEIAAVIKEVEFPDDKRPVPQTVGES